MTTTDTGQKSVSYFTQLKAMLWRNFLIKKRNRRTIAECFLPMAMLSLFIVSSQFFSGESSKPILIDEPADTPITLSLMNSGAGPYLIYVVPDTSETRKFSEEILSYWRETSPTAQHIAFEFLDNEKQLEEIYYSSKRSGKQVNLAIVFDVDLLPNLSYTIRTNPYLGIPSPSTIFAPGGGCREPNGSSLYPEYSSSCPINSYFYSNFLAVQRIIEGTWLKLTLPKGTPEYLNNFTMQLFPKGPSVDNASLNAVRYLMPFYMVVTLSYFILYLLNVIVKEKERKIKEGLRMMGLRDSIYWLSWFLVYMVFIICLSFIATLILFQVKVFENSNSALVFLLFVLYDMSIIMLAFLFTTFFDSPRVAGTFGALTVCFLNLFYYIQVATGDATPTWVYWLLCLISPTGFALGMDKAILLEVNTQHGVSTANLWAGPGLPLAGAYIMLAVDIVLYGLLAYYLDNVLPSEHGAKRSPFFCLQFWSKKRSLSGETNEAYNGDRDNEDIEPVHDSIKERAALKVRGLSKTFHPFGKEAVKAVRGISLDVYEGQITAILGHNGAGKTTLFNMLTGMTRPSEGSAFFYGCDLSDPSQSAGIKQMTGVCPQHDVLFEQLTTREHLKFYAKIRGMKGSIVENEVDDIIKDIGLEDKADSQSIKLSGGQMRKLSIGIALIGDPKIVFLDEPTAGVDPYSRRQLWNALQKRKGEKIILLTTHFMDEADLLADRKAIITQGKLRCLGSSLFLKNKFGLGYHLTFVLNENFRDTAKIQQVIHHHLPEAKLNRHFGRELSYLLPREKLAAFSPLFSYLEGLVKRGEANEIGFTSYGVSMTSLEEVFLKIGEEAEQQKLIEEEREMNDDPDSKPKTEENQMDDWELFNELEAPMSDRRNRLALKELLKLRARNMIRDHMAIVYQVLLPVAFAAFGIFLGTRSSTTTKATKQLFTLDKYHKELSSQPFLNSGSESSMLEFWQSFAELNSLEISKYSGEFSEIVEFLYKNVPHAFAIDTRDDFKLNSTSQVEFLHTRLRLNDTFVHLPPIILNAISNALLTLNNVTERISLSVYPLPGVDPINAGQFTCALFIGIVFAFGPTNLACEMVLDREIQAKNLLRVNGLSFLLYYGAFFIVLGSMMMAACWLIIMLIVAFKFQALISSAASGTLTLLCVMYCPVGILFAMCASFIFKTLESAQSMLPSLLTLTGTLPYLLVMVCNMFPGSLDVATWLHITFCFIDVLYIPYGIVFYIIKVYLGCLSEFGENATDTCNNLSFNDYMTPEIITIFVAIFFQFGLYSVVLYVLDIKSAGGKVKEVFRFSEKTDSVEIEDIEAEIFPGQGDSDVIQEYLRVRRLMNTPAAKRDVQPAVMIQDLHKKYKPSRTICCRTDAAIKEKSAVETLSFAVQPGEVFGLLGHNGAGKTTTMKIITAEEAATHGKVEVAGYDISSDRSKAFQKLGYCPQHDALWQNITIKEHLKVYASIRGIEPSHIKTIVKLFLRGLQIEEHAEKYAKECSGGTKRKLSYAIAMLGNPAIVLMDEPSTGMDPQSKRFLWNTISASFKGKRGAVLTTHSMEEADALCSRMGIMVSGELRCLGTGQHLKNRYGNGYLLEIKLKPQTSGTSVERVDALMTFLRETFTNTTFYESFEDRISFNVPQEGIKSLALTFDALEAAREQLSIEEYSFSQTTLEQVFLRFANDQEREQEESLRFENEKERKQEESQSEL